jgi:hypothetical protein
MNQLRVLIESPDGMAVGWRVPTTIREIDGDNVQDILVTTGPTPVAVSVTPGNYIVEAYLPSGEMLRGRAPMLSGQDATVRLLMAPSPHEWLATSARMTQANRYRATDQSHIAGGLVSAQAGADFVPNPFIALQSWLDQPLGRSAAVPTVEDNTVARFDFSSASFHVGPPPLGAPPPMNGFIFTAFKGSSRSAVALPLGWINANKTAESAYEIVLNKTTGTTSAIIQDADFAPVLGYLADGQASLASRALNEQAVELLNNKLQNPFGAAAGGYVLLQRALQNSEKNSSWRTWIRNLTQWFPLLPDGFVIRGTLLLHNLRAYGDPDIDALQAAKECFLQSVQLGVPLFSVGVRLLLDGLLALDSTIGVLDPNLTWVRRLSMFVDPHEAFTTLRIGPTG